MKAGKGKEKGGEYERLICAKISKWLSNGERDDLLCRTVGSGSQFTSVKKGHPGDIRAQDSPLAFEFCSKYAIECKHWRDVEMIKFLRRQGDLFKALQKVRQEGIDTRRGFWLVVRQNNQPDMLFTGLRRLLDEDLKPEIVSFPEYHILYSETVHMYYLSEFLDKVNPIKYVLV